MKAKADLAVHKMTDLMGRGNPAFQDRSSMDARGLFGWENRENLVRMRRLAGNGCRCIPVHSLPT